MLVAKVWSKMPKNGGASFLLTRKAFDICQSLQNQILLIFIAVC